MKRMISHVGGLIAGLQSYSRTAVVFKLALLVSGLLCFYQIVEAAPRLSRKPTAGVPTAEVTLNGSGFSAYEAVDVYFDTEDLRLCATNARGEFSCTLQVPREANSGIHWLTAVGRQSGRAAQKSFTVRVNWSQFHYGSGHRGYNPYENLISVDNVADLNVAWSFATEVGFSSSPIVANGLVYVSSDKLQALDATTGAEKWSYPTAVPHASTPAVANGMVYVGSSDTKLYALDAKTGAFKWSYTTGCGIYPSPVVANGMIYVGSDKLYALDAKTGAFKWSYNTGGVSYPPAVANGMVYVGSVKLYALDVTTGAEKWNYTTYFNYPEQGSITSSPVVANGMVYVGSSNGNLYCLKAATGEFMWKLESGTYAKFSTVAVAKGVVYVSKAVELGETHFHALDATTGIEKWDYPVIGFPSSSPVVANGVVYVGSDKLYALDVTKGYEKWSYVMETSGEWDKEFSPVVANGMVYAVSNDGKLYCFSLDPGWEFDREILRPDPATLIPDERLELQVEK